MVLDHPVKVLHRIWRNDLLAAVACAKRSTQCGGFPGMAADMAIAAIGGFVEGAHRARRPAAVLFVDFTAAYDSADLGALFGDVVCPQAMRRELAAIGVRP